MPSSTLLFVKQGEDIRALVVSSGDILRLVDGRLEGDFEDVGGNTEELKNHLERMTVDGLKSVFSSLGRVEAVNRATGRRAKMNKPQLEIPTYHQLHCGLVNCNRGGMLLFLLNL